MPALTTQEVKALLQIDDESLNSYIETIIPIIEEYVRDYINLPKELEIPHGLKLTMAKMIEFNLTDVGISNKTIKDVSIQFNTDYTSDIYKSLNKYRRLRTL